MKLKVVPICKWSTLYPMNLNGKKVMYNPLNINDQSTLDDSLSP